MEPYSKVKIEFSLEKKHEKIGEIEIQLSDRLLIDEEIEQADNFHIEYETDCRKIDFKGSYYIIILNKKLFLDKHAKQPVKQPSVQSKSPRISHD